MGNPTPARLHRSRELLRDAAARTDPLDAAPDAVSIANSGVSAGAIAGYAAEELVAELGAAFLCADLAITPEPRADHASYIASWLEVLKNDKRAIFTASAHAQRAADYLHGLQQPVETSGPPRREGPITHFDERPLD